MSNNRIFGLDILRAFAILSVLYIHFLDFFPKSHYLNYLKILEFDGVLYFFVLSGFLIGNIMIKSFSKSLKFSELISFWIRRWYRTIPNYILILVILVVIYAEYKWRVFKFIIFVQGFFKPQADFFNESWSLAVEEWFYLLFPLFLLVLKQTFGLDLKKSFVGLCIFVVLFIPMLRYVYYIHYQIVDKMSWDYFIRQISVLRFDSIIFGVIGSYFYNFKNEIWFRYKKESLILGIIFILMFKIIEYWFPELIWKNSNGLFFMSVLYFSIMSFLILLLLPYLSEYRTDKRNIFTVSVTKISIISYSVYLLNYSLVKNFILGNLNLYFSNYFLPIYVSLLNVLLFYSLTIGLSVLLYHYFELPVMNLRDKIQLPNYFKKNEIN